MGVVPRVGTWIEILLKAGKKHGAVSSPAWGRGLTSKTNAQMINAQASSPAWGRGLKYLYS